MVAFDCHAGVRHYLSVNTILDAVGESRNAELAALLEDTSRVNVGVEAVLAGLALGPGSRGTAGDGTGHLGG